MSEAPLFFVPEATPDMEESVYAEFAKWCGRPVPSRGRRIYSITFVHDCIEWTATVGEPLRGIQIRSTRSRGKRIERTEHVSDPAVVLSIFPCAPYMVVTNYGIIENVVSKWDNPLLAGEPISITYFSISDNG